MARTRPAGGSNQVEQQTLCLERVPIAGVTAGFTACFTACFTAAVTAAVVRSRERWRRGAAVGSRGARRGLGAAAALALAASPAALAPARGLRVVGTGGERAERGERCGPRDGRGRFGTRAVRRRAGLARVGGPGPALRMTPAAAAGLPGAGRAGA